MKDHLVELGFLVRGLWSSGTLSREPRWLRRRWQRPTTALDVVKKNPCASLVEAEGVKLRLHGFNFGTDEPCIALLPGLRHAIVSENDGVRGVDIRNEVGDSAVIANNEMEEAQFVRG